MSSIKTIILTNNNIRTVCRVCLEDKTNQLPLIAIFKFRDENVFPLPTINEMLHKVDPELITTEMDFPQRVCYKCVDLLKTAYKFKLKLEEATNLLTLFLNSVEGENEDCFLPVVADDIEPYLFCDVSGTAINTETRVEELDCNNQKVITVDNNITDNFSSSNNQVSRAGITSEREFEELDCNNLEIITYNRAYNHKSANESIDALVTYPCPMCTAELPTTFELKKHVQTHQGFEKYINTRKVKKKVKFYAEPRNNLSIFNQTEILHKCPHCNVVFSAEQFPIHVVSHDKQDQFQCDKCKRVFKTKSHLNTHQVKKHSKKYPYWCGKCNKGYIVEQTYKFHMLEHTVTSAELPLQCSYCPKRFSNPKYLYRHHVYHKARKHERLYKCNVCHGNFPNHEELEAHRCEATVVKHIPCKFCNQMFTDLRLLQTHLSEAHKHNSTSCPVNYKKEKLCDLCGKRFETNYQLDIHMRVHTGEKPFPCDQCGKQFPTKRQTQRHLMRMHAEQPRFMCSICGKSFYKHYLSEHEKTHREMTKHVCAACNKRFSCVSQLKKHLKFHEHA